MNRNGLFKVDLIATVPASSLLALRDVLTLPDPAEETSITLPAHTHFEHRIEAAFEAEELRSGNRVETSSLSSACHIVAEGIGVTVADPFTALTVLSSRLAVRRLSPRLERVHGFPYPIVGPYRCRHGVAGNESLEAIERVEPGLILAGKRDIQFGLLCPG